MLWALLTITLLGVLLLTLGLVGRVVGDSPHCRACKFDLTGLDLSPDEALCPECAAKLAEPQAVRTGLRLRRRKLVILGVLLLLPSGAGVVAAFNWTSWNASKPVPLLVLDGRLGTDTISRAAVEELRSRYFLNQLSASQQKSYGSMLAGRLASRTPIDLYASGDLVQLHEKGMVDESRWVRVLDRLYRIGEQWTDQFEYPQRYTLVRDRHGRMVGEEEFPEPPEPDPFLNGPITFVYALVEAKVDGKPIALIDYGKWRAGLYPGFGWGEKPRPRYKSVEDRLASSGRFVSENGVTDPVLGVVKSDTPLSEWEAIPAPQSGLWLGNLPAGEHTLQTRWRIEMYALDRHYKSSQNGMSELDKAVAIPMGVHTVETAGRLIITEAGGAAFEPVTDPVRLAQARDFVSFHDGTGGITIGGAPPAPPPQPKSESATRWLYLSTTAKGIPIDANLMNRGAGVAMFGRLYIEIDGERLEHDPWHVYLRPDQGLHTQTGFDEHFFRVEIPVDTQDFDVVFVPDPDAAADGAAPWLTDHGTPMPTAAAEIRWENIPIAFKD